MQTEPTALSLARLWDGLLGVIKEYNKNICQIQYKVGDAVWHMIKGTKVVNHAVKKFLPSYKGPYFIVGLLEDLVYCIQKSKRSNVKVIPHDKLKPY